jgi:hypothetical protein
MSCTPECRSESRLATPRPAILVGSISHVWAITVSSICGIWLLRDLPPIDIQTLMCRETRGVSVWITLFHKPAWGNDITAKAEPIPAIFPLFAPGLNRIWTPFFYRMLEQGRASENPMSELAVWQG